jgi:hypothetical protein
MVMRISNRRSNNDFSFHYINGRIVLFFMNNIIRYKISEPQLVITQYRIVDFLLNTATCLFELSL